MSVAHNVQKLTQQVVIANHGRHRRLPLMRRAKDNNPDWFHFYRLTSLNRPGLTADQFFDLLTQCRCGLIMARSAFPRHYCSYVIIDLTQETDNEDATDVDLPSQDQDA